MSCNYVKPILIYSGLWLVDVLLKRPLVGGYSKLPKPFPFLLALASSSLKPLPSPPSPLYMSAPVTPDIFCFSLQTRTPWVGASLSRQILPLGVQLRSVIKLYTASYSMPLPLFLPS